MWFINNLPTIFFSLLGITILVWIGVWLQNKKLKKKYPEWYEAGFFDYPL